MASGIDALGEGLRQGGSLDAVGEFTLDADKARDKLRRFQLAVPQHYVLLLVQAAVLRGATAVDFAIDGDDVWMRADGRPFTDAELRDVYGAIFTERRDRDRLARHYLALGINAAMSLSPRHVRVLSGAVALTLREGRPDELGEHSEGDATTEIHVRDRFHPRILVQMWKRGESDVLRARCHLSDVPITVNGAPVQRGLALPERVRCVETVELAHGYAHVGVDDHRRPAAAEITTAGVWIAAHPLPLPRGFVAHVRADLLAKDVSQADVVRDADYAALAAAVEAAGLRSLARLVDLALAGDFRGYAVSDLVTWLFDQASPELPAALRAAPDRYPPARLPIWRTLGGARVSTLDLVAADRLRVVDALPSLMLPEFADILLVERVGGDAPATGDTVDPSAFLHITFAGKVENGDAAVARAIARENGRRRFLARPHPPRLEEGAYLERLSFGEGTSVRGEVGLRAAGSVRPTLLILVEGCILEEVALPGPMPGLVAVLAAPAHPNEDYTRAARHSTLAGAFLQLLAVTERLVAAAALHLGPDIQGRPLVREQLLDYIQAALSPTFVEDFLVGVGFARQLAQDVVGHLEAGALRPAWGLGGGGVPHPLAGVSLFPVQGGEALSLADLAGLHRRGEPLWWLPAPADEVDRPVLILDTRLRAWVEATLTRAALTSYTPHLERLRKERALLGRPADAIETAPTLIHVPIRHGRVHGTVGVEVSPPRGREVISGHEIHVRLFKRSRHLGDASLTTLVPHVIAAANDDDADMIRRDLPPAVAEAIDAALPQLILAAAHLAATHLATAAALSPHLRAVLLAVPLAVYPRADLFEAHLRLIRELGSTAAAAPFAALVRGSARHPPERLRLPLRRALAAAAPLDVDAVLAELGAPSLPVAHDRLAALRLALLAALPAVLALPLIPASAGPTDLARVLARARERGPLDVVDEGTALDGYTDHEGPLLLVDPPLRALLVALLGASGIRDGAPILERHRARKRFAARPRAATIALDPRAHLVKLTFPEGEITGEIGLARVHPSDPPRAAIHVHRDHRRVTTLGGDDLAVPLIAALEVPDAELDAACTGLTKRGARGVLAFCKRQIEPLLHHLALTYQTLPLADRPLAAAWLRHRLIERIEAGGVASPTALKKLRRDPVVGLPLLRDVRGEPRTIAEAIATYQEGQVLRYSREAHPDLGDALLVTPEEDPLIEALFPVRFDVGAERQRTAAARDRRDRSPRLAAGPPADAITHRELDGDLRGALWIAPAGDGSPALDALVALGADGHEADRVVLIDHLACGGALSGRGVIVAPEWDRAHLDRKHLRRVRRAALSLWKSLVAEYRRGMTALDRLVAEPDALARLGRVRDALWIQLLALHRAHQGKKLNASAREILEDLLDLPLLPLANDRLISLSLALREQPAELVFLGLWEPPAPEPSAPEPPAPEPSAPEPSAPEPSAPEPAAAAPPHPLAQDAEPFDPPAPVDPPAVAPPPPEPTAEERLLEALRAELRCVRGPGDGALTDGHLASLVIGSGSGRQIAEEAGRFYVIDLAHPLVLAARERGARDPLLLSMLASAVYTYLNARLAEIEDHDEAAFHADHARHLLSGVVTGRSPR